MVEKEAIDFSSLYCPPAVGLVRVNPEYPYLLISRERIPAGYRFQIGSATHIKPLHFVAKEMAVGYYQLFPDATVSFDGNDTYGSITTTSQVTPDIVVKGNDPHLLTQTMVFGIPDLFDGPIDIAQGSFSAEYTGSVVGRNLERILADYQHADGVYDPHFTYREIESYLQNLPEESRYRHLRPLLLGKQRSMTLKGFYNTGEIRTRLPENVAQSLNDHAYWTLGRIGLFLDETENNRRLIGLVITRKITNYMDVVRIHPLLHIPVSDQQPLDETVLSKWVAISESHSALQPLYGARSWNDLYYALASPELAGEDILRTFKNADYCIDAELPEEMKLVLRNRLHTPEFA